MFPAAMPWPMTLAPTNEVVRQENHVEKTFIRKKNYRQDPGGYERCKDSITIKKKEGFVRVGEELIELKVSRKYLSNL
jgi:hypothetical protein